MTDEFGMFQFASNISPNKDFGYTLDDNARALIVCLWLSKREATQELKSLITIYFIFIQRCLQKDGSFINYIGYNKLPTKQNTAENLEDVHGRALWALAEILGNNSLSIELKIEAKRIFLIALEKSFQFTHLRAQAFAIKAFALAQKEIPTLRKELLVIIEKYANNLVSSFKKNSDKSWIWFENKLTYNNGILPESLFIASEVINNGEYNEIGEKTLKFLINTMFIDKKYVPIGNLHWYQKNMVRSLFDQQPEDPASMILVLYNAYKYTKNREYRRLALQCFRWFLGDNILDAPLYDSVSFGCHDGLNKNGINSDQGAESLISYLMSYHIAQTLLSAKKS
jgi:uncharacterized protein YyaL (SSP411 family)